MRVSSTVALTLLVGSLVAGCGDDAPTTPTPTPSTAPRFTGQLTPGNEVPPVTNADSSGSGTVTVTLNVTRDAAQNITAATADFQVSLSGFPANTSLTGAHIHAGRAGANAGVIVNLAIAAGDITLPSGTATFSRTAINVAADVAQNMLNDPAGFYFNVHTTLNPAGAIRAQLVRQ